MNSATCVSSPGRVAGVDPDERAEQLAGLALDLGDDGGIDAGDVHD